MKPCIYSSSSFNYYQCVAIPVSSICPSIFSPLQWNPCSNPPVTSYLIQKKIPNPSSGKQVFSASLSSLPSLYRLAPCLSHQLLALSQSGRFSASCSRAFALVSSAWKARSPSHQMSSLACALSSFSFLQPGFADCLHIARSKYSLPFQILQIGWWESEFKSLHCSPFSCSSFYNYVCELPLSDFYNEMQLSFI